MTPDRRLMEFIGVHTAGSSSMQLFGRWAGEFGVEGAELVGRDLPLQAEPARYRDAVEEIGRDTETLGALVTTHKVGLYAAAAGHFDRIDPLAELCREISCISKRDGRLIGHAKDPVTAGQALADMLDADHFARTGGQVLCLGAGGAGVAIAAHFLAHADPAARPERLILADVDPARLAVAREVVERTGADRPAVSLIGADSAAEAVPALPPGSMIVNATGMGKDRPGSPLPAGTVFPRGAVVWELNYRGELDFLQNARSQADERELRLVDGWLYFLHGWCEHMAQVFDRPVTPELFARFRRVSDEWRAEP